eukprot:358727-Chlamydomonas_euryale.AAC.11
MPASAQPVRRAVLFTRMHRSNFSNFLGNTQFHPHSERNLPECCFLCHFIRAAADPNHAFCLCLCAKAPRQRQEQDPPSSPPFVQKKVACMRHSSERDLQRRSAVHRGVIGSVRRST